MPIPNKIIILLCLIFHTSISAEQFIHDYTVQNKQLEPFSSPTNRQLDFESFSRLKSNLNAIGAKTKHMDWWNDIIRHEERGVFGYHAAKQQYRIFQDIIKMIFVEVLEFEIKNDFHFFRIPLDPILNEYDSSADFLKSHPHPNDRAPPDRDQILSMNYTLYGNSSIELSCSVCYFSKNQSGFNIAYSKKLEFLFNELGMPVKEIQNLFKAGDSIADFETGVLYQFTDLSHQQPNFHNAYELVDQLVYPALKGGKFDNNVHVNLSDIFLSDLAKRFDSQSGQLRLIMNTATSLNPYSSISIRRYDQLDLKIIEKYESLIRQQIQNLPRNSTKVENYKQKLKAHWHAKD
ncbi:MAG: hypothetical protein H0U49_03305 [Parachlamydiaceae bacterium]|nr:hypothetical protein [Parachlamydiaceae bacterium]